MPSAFKVDLAGPYIDADPGSDLDYSVSSWLEGLLFTAVIWSISPAVVNVPYNDQINASPVVIDGRTYAPGQIASAWIKDLQPGVTYEVNLAATFTGGRKDQRTFRIVCKQL